MIENLLCFLSAVGFAFLILLAHELLHIVAARLLGYPVEGVVIGFWRSYVDVELEHASSRDKIAIYMAPQVLTLFFLIMFISTSWTFYATLAIAHIFSSILDFIKAVLVVILKHAKPR